MTNQLEKGKYGPIFPKTPACYGFTIIANVMPGRADAIRAYGLGLAKALESNPNVLAPLKLHYLRWVLFDHDTRRRTSTPVLAATRSAGAEGFGRDPRPRHRGGLGHGTCRPPRHAVHRRRRLGVRHLAAHVPGSTAHKAAL